MDENERCERDGQAEAKVAEQDVLVRASDECDEDGELERADDKLCAGAERERRKRDDCGGCGVGDLAHDPEQQEATEVGAK
jgi:hypothetical protein